MSPRRSRRKHRSQSWHNSVCSADMAGRLGGGNLFSLLLLHHFNILLIILAFHLLRARIRQTESEGFSQGRRCWTAASNQHLLSLILLTGFNVAILAALWEVQEKPEIFSCSAPLLHSSSPPVYLRQKSPLTTTINLGSQTAVIP